MKKEFYLVSLIKNLLRMNIAVNSENIKNFVHGDIVNYKTIDNIIKLRPDKIIYTISLNHFDSESSLTNSIRINVLPFLHLILQNFSLYHLQILNIL